MLKSWFSNLNSLILTFVLIFSSVTNVNPANAVANGNYPCGTSGFFQINSNLVFAHPSCRGSVTIPDGVTEIYGYEDAFNSGLTSVTLPASLTTINDRAFIDGNFTFLGNAPTTVGTGAFPTGATANVAYNATGFPANGSTWNGLIVVYGNAPSPANDSDSSPIPVVVPVEVEKSDAEFDLKDRKSISKRDMKITLSKNQSFKRNPKDLYKYSIFGTSKKTCAIKGNFVVALKETGVCEMWLSRTTPTGAKNKYWVKINYSN